ncbi:MAG TPA: ABC transporter permease [Methylomirabilota bacterium]|nr:ABC transporter permease [Methylomirabilota bacterium]
MPDTVALRHPRAEALARLLGLVAFALAVFAAVLLVFGKDPLRAYLDVLAATLGSAYGLSETIVKMIPLVLTALAVAIPGRIWLINVGGEGQLFIGALAATGAALHLAFLPGWLLPVVMAAAGVLGGGLWAAASGVLHARGWVSETISTLLLNYVAVLLVNFAVFGPWRDPEGVNYPQTAELVPAAILPALGTTRVHLGLVFALAALVLWALVMRRTRWGLEVRAIGGNAEAARRAGIPIGRYVVALMFLGGGMAGLAGMAEVSAIQGRLRPSLSPGYGYSGFLIAWMARGHPVGIVAAAFGLAVITAGGDILQMTQALPGSVVNILMAVMLFVVLGREGARR